MKKAFFLAFSLFLLASSAQAVCPVCTVAVSAGVGLCRWLGVDDLISGTWIGGLCVSITIWILNWLKGKKIDFKFPAVTVSIAVYALTIVPLYFLGIMGHPSNTFLGIDKLLFGTITGSLVFLFSVWLYGLLKEKNNGKPYFPYQKVAMPVLFLIIASLIFYYSVCRI